MSLERELLQRCLDEFEYKGVACNELCIDINKLLAQPEPTSALPKREPLSDEELKNLYDRHAFAMESDEYMWGFRDAEKAHGIGGEE